MPATSEVPSAPAPRARRGRALLRYAALGVVVAFIAIFVVQEREAFVEGVRRLDVPSLVVALLAIALGLMAAMMSWRAVLTGLGSRLPVLAAARVYFLGQLGKYVPGSVWPIVAQAELSKEYGVPRARAGLAAMVQMLVGLVVGVAIASLALATSSPDAFRAYWWIMIAAVAGVVALAPPVFNRVVALALRITRRPPAEPVAGRAVVVSALWCVGMWSAFGTHMWVLMEAIGADASRMFLLATGGYALAWVVGFLIVVLPAGAGAREAALVLALSPALGREDALVLALVSRFLMLIGDLGAAGGAIVAERVRDRRPGARDAEHAGEAPHAG